MTVYRQPTFNLLAAVWRNGNPTANPPDLVTPANLSPGRLVQSALSNIGTGADVIGGMWLRVPAQTDIRDGKDAVGPDTVEVPIGSGRFYRAVWVDDIGSGFSNEHRFAELLGLAPWPVPFPGGGGGVTISWTTGTGYGGSAGVAVNAINPNFSVSRVGTYVLVVHLAQAPAAEVVTINGVVIAPDQSQGPLVRGGVTSFVNIYHVTTVVGFNTVNIAIPAAGTGIFQFSTVFVYLGLNLLDAGGNSIGALSVPSVTPAAPSVAAPEIFVAAYAMLDPAAPVVWDMPFQIYTNVDVSYAVLGIQMYLTIAAAAIPVIGSPIATVGAITPFQWAGVMTSFQ